jgi:GntR family transcriptional regulator/MocR family aminotransferase
MGIPFNPLDRTKPLVDQLVSQVMARVGQDPAATGARLPSIRGLAVELGVNRNTVAQAYKELAQKGYLDSRFGGGSTLRRPGDPGAAPAAARRFDHLDWERRFAGHFAAFALPAAPPARDGGEPPVNLFQLHPHTGLFPLDAFRLCLNTVLRRQGRALLNYGSPAGYLPLRERIAARLKRQRIPVTPAQILVTSGSQQGIDLLARAFLNPGDGVVVESPMYSIALKIFQMNGAALIPYAVGPGGVSLAGLESALGRNAPKLFYAVPNFQNPTAHSYTGAEKQALLAQVYRTGGLLIEDASDAELHRDAESRPALAALDGLTQTLHLNTFSKTLVPAVRVGYLAGPAPVMHRLTELKEMTDLSHSLILQAAISEFMERGLFDRHVAAVRDFYRARMELAVEMLEQALPEEAPFARPGGGLCTWVDLPPQVDTAQLYRQLAQAGVLVSPGALYQPVPGGRNGLRLCVAAEPEERLRRGIAILGAELRRLLSGRVRPPAIREYQSIH